MFPLILLVLGFIPLKIGLFFHWIIRRGEFLVNIFIWLFICILFP
jgi:hypothetical protein